ncbi:MAG TPA: ANTAR domain-containing protein [Geodermatophilus sp.]|nr:ANTAR domain-containing protein [Geodermatophilus sp.]
MTSIESRSFPTHRGPTPPVPSATLPPRPPAHRPSAERRAGLSGRWRHDRRTGAWEWSAETTALLGLPADGAGAEELIAVHHPEDRPRTIDALSGALSGAQAFSLRVRVGAVGGPPRTVVLVGEPRLDTEGRVAGVEGLVVAGPEASADDDRVAALEAEVAQLRTAMANRAPIEQAKGVLMLLTGCGEQMAFELLAHISSRTHRKVRDVSLDLVASASGRRPLSADVREILRDACPPGAAGR